MNRLVVSIILLVVLTAISFGSLFAVDIVTDKMLQLVDDVESAYQLGDNERSCDSAEELEELWEDFMDFSLLLNDIGQAVEITSCIADISSFAQQGNDELFSACDRAQAQIELLKDSQVPTLWKVL